MNGYKIFFGLIFLLTLLVFNSVISQNSFSEQKQLYQQDFVVQPNYPPDIINHFGHSVEIFDDIIIVAGLSSPQDGSDVHIYMKDYGGINNWGLFKVISKENRGSHFAESIAISKDYIAVGSPYYDQVGAVFFFGRDYGGTNNWGLEKIVFPDSSIAINNNLYFGSDVAIDGEVLVVGSPLGAGNSGWAFIYSTI